MSAGKVPHPYHPRDLVIPNYVPNEISLTETLAVFFGVVAVAIVGFWVFLGKQTHIRGSLLTKSKLCWFFSCGLIHSILEGYFAVYHKTLAGEQTYLAQIWKEYGKGDSRYVISDTFMVCMESITAFIDGPLAFLAVYAFVTQKPYRYVVQLALSLCQMYGVTLYFTMEMKDGYPHSEMGHLLYFWFYFFFMNVLWVVIPSACVIEAVGHLMSAQASFDSKESNINKNKRK